MKRVSKKDVNLALDILKRSLNEAKIASDDLSKSDSNIDYGRYLGLMEAITVIKTIVL